MKSITLTGSKLHLLDQILFILKNKGACFYKGSGLVCSMCLIYSDMCLCPRQPAAKSPGNTAGNKEEQISAIYNKAKESLDKNFTRADIVEILV